MGVLLTAVALSTGRGRGEGVLGVGSRCADGADCREVEGAVTGAVGGGMKDDGTVLDASSAGWGVVESSAGWEDGDP